MSVFSWRCPEMLFEEPVKMLGIFKACHIADFRHADVCCSKKSAGFLKTKALYDLGKGFSGVRFDKPGAVALGKMKSFCKLLESNGIKMFFHILDQFHTYQISPSGHKGILNPLLIILKDFCEKNHKLAVENVFIIILFFCVFQKHGKYMLPEAFVSVCVENEIGVSCIGKQGLVKKQGNFISVIKHIVKKVFESSTADQDIQDEAGIKYADGVGDVRGKEAELPLCQGDFVLVDFLGTGAAKYIGKLKEYVFVAECGGIAVVLA